MSDEIIELINKAKAHARRDNFLSFLGKNSKIAFRVILIVATAGIVWIGFSVYKKANQEKFAEIFHLSLVDQQTGELEKAKEKLKKIAEDNSAPSGIKSLASLRYAAFLLEENKKSEAVKIYLEVANCGSCENYVRDLAKLLAVKVWMSDESELQKADLNERIKKLEDSAKILKGNIAEQRAFLELKKNNLEEAHKIFVEIEKISVKQPNLQARAVDGIKMVEGKGFQPKAEEKK
jgi:hypothetical protein